LPEKKLKYLNWRKDAFIRVKDNRRSFWERRTKKIKIDKRTAKGGANQYGSQRKKKIKSGGGGKPFNATL